MARVCLELFLKSYASRFFRVMSALLLMFLHLSMHVVEEGHAVNPNVDAPEINVVTRQKGLRCAT
ncbi:unnamed protein product [Plutella xylostella]|uniref:(diamondback moth) hypothetical protein n=1 Tax=Plutella xylostella TaxID=51655 RepID=A0A8S4F337_PLUXY|nr:unnamed protein product [Plutella xylostella]